MEVLDGVLVLVSGIRLVDGVVVPLIAESSPDLWLLEALVALLDSIIWHDSSIEAGSLVLAVWLWIAGGLRIVICTCDDLVGDSLTIW